MTSTHPRYPGTDTHVLMWDEVTHPQLSPSRTWLVVRISPGAVLAQSQPPRGSGTSVGLSGLSLVSTSERRDP